MSRWWNWSDSCSICGMSLWTIAQLIWNRLWTVYWWCRILPHIFTWGMGWPRWEHGWSRLGLGLYRSRSEPVQTCLGAHLRCTQSPKFSYRPRSKEGLRSGRSALLSPPAEPWSTEMASKWSEKSGYLPRMLLILESWLKHQWWLYCRYFLGLCASCSLFWLSPFLESPGIWAQITVGFWAKYQNHFQKTLNDHSWWTNLKYSVAWSPEQEPQHNLILHKWKIAWRIAWHLKSVHQEDISPSFQNSLYDDATLSYSISSKLLASSHQESVHQLDMDELHEIQTNLFRSFQMAERNQELIFRWLLLRLDLYPSWRGLDWHWYLWFWFQATSPFHHWSS